MGQVQCKKKKKKKKKAQKHTNDTVPFPEKKGKILLWISKGSGEGPKQSGKAFVLEEKASATAVKAPSLGTMKQFASGRGTLCDFDFTLAER